MTKIYIRVKRSNKWTKVEIEHATAKERNDYITALPNKNRKALINKLVKIIRRVEDEL